MYKLIETIFRFNRDSVVLKLYTAVDKFPSLGVNVHSMVYCVKLIGLAIIYLRIVLRDALPQKTSCLRKYPSFAFDNLLYFFVLEKKQHNT